MAKKKPKSAEELAQAIYFAADDAIEGLSNEEAIAVLEMAIGHFQGQIEGMEEEIEHEEGE